MKTKLAFLLMCGVVGPSLEVAGQETEYPALPPGYPSLDAPWTFGPASKSQGKPPEPATTTDMAPETEPGALAEGPAPLAGLGPMPTTRARKHEVSVSGDYLLGRGDVTLPFAFSLFKRAPDLAGSLVSVVKPDRESDYYGSTISYGYSQTWYFDFGYAHGESSGNVPFPGLGGDSAFNITDDWYQGYIRYAFPGLRGRKLTAYLRAGVTYVDAEMKAEGVLPLAAPRDYVQDNQTEDLLGNLGFGLGYSLYASRHVRLALQMEGEGFYGQRSQESREELPGLLPGEPVAANIDNDLYGGIVRGTFRFEYRFGGSGALRAFADAGVQAKFTQVEYSSFGPFDGGGFSELLWGPYIKAGLRYSF